MINELRCVEEQLCIEIVDSLSE